MIRTERRANSAFTHEAGLLAQYPSQSDRLSPVKSVLGVQSHLEDLPVPLSGSPKTEVEHPFGWMAAGQEASDLVRQPITHRDLSVGRLELEFPLVQPQALLRQATCSHDGELRHVLGVIGPPVGEVTALQGRPAVVRQRAPEEGPDGLLGRLALRGGSRVQGATSPPNDVGAGGGVHEHPAIGGLGMHDHPALAHAHVRVVIPRPQELHSDLDVARLDAHRPGQPRTFNYPPR
jgi:hypothetical protein